MAAMGKIDRKTTLYKLEEYIVISIGTLIMACGIYFFKFPNNFTTGGVSGMATILGKLFPAVSKGTFVTGINVAFLVAGFLMFGTNFAFKTVYSSMLLSLSISAMEYLIPLTAPLTEQKFAELFISVGLCAVGSSIVFAKRASTGGTDILAMILQKFTAFDIGKMLLCADAVIAFLAFVVFNVEMGIFSIIGLVVKALIVDNVIDSISMKKCVTVITTESEKICTYINQDLKRSATITDSYGAYTHRDQKTVLTVLGRGETVKLKDYVKTVDKSAFVIVMNSNEIVGKGFRTSVN